MKVYPMMIIVGLMGSLLYFVTIFATATLGALLWAVLFSFLGLVFPETMRAFMTAVGLMTIEPWQFGIICGWISAIFRAGMPTIKVDD